MTLRNFYYTFSALAAIVVWAYWSTLTKAADRWIVDVQYSHGWLIPLFSIYLLYHRRDMLEKQKLKPSWWCLPFVAVAIGLRWMEQLFFWNGLDGWSMVPMFLGALLAAGGWAAFRWGWQSAVFLLFMVPLPYAMHTGMSTQLQGVATDMSTFTLQLLGLPAVAEGTLIKIDNAPISVAEACSGLGMIATFLALSVAAVFLISSPWWVKAGLLLGAIPVSLICNMVRIVIVGGFKYAGYSSETVDNIHEAAGWFMILLGCALIFVELYVLERIVIVQDNSRDNDTPLGLPYGSTPAGGQA